MPATADHPRPRAHLGPVELPSKMLAEPQLGLLQNAALRPLPVALLLRLSRREHASGAPSCALS
eukprot:7594633-Pyramimonas_sp.AAC.1